MKPVFHAMNISHDPVMSDLNKHMAELDENAVYERKEEAVMQRAEEIAAEMISKKGFDDNGAHYDLGDVTEHIYDSDDDGTFHLLLAGLLDDETEASQIFMKSLLMKHATAVAEDIAWREAG